MLTLATSSPHTLYNQAPFRGTGGKRIPVIKIHVVTGSAGGFDIESQNLDKGGDFDNEFSAVEVILVLSLSETASLTQLLIFCLGRREVLMSYFIALFQEVSPCRQSHL